MELAQTILKYKPYVEMLINVAKDRFMCKSKSGLYVWDLDVIKEGSIVTPSECVSEPYTVIDYTTIDPMYSINWQVRNNLLRMTAELAKEVPGITSYATRKHKGISLTLGAFAKIYQTLKELPYYQNGVPPTIEEVSGVEVIDLSLPPPAVASQVPCNGIRYNPYFCATRDVFKDIYDLEPKKVAVLGWLKNPFGEGYLRPKILYIVGPPATGKTVFLDAVLSKLKVMNHSKAFTKPVELSGRTTTWRGLIDLILASDVNMYVIDELDKANADFFNKIIEMYNGRITNTIHRTGSPSLVIRGQFFIVATGNSMSRFPTPLIDRMVPVTFELNTKMIIEVVKRIFANRPLNEERLRYIVEQMVANDIEITVRKITGIYSSCDVYASDESFKVCVKEFIRGYGYG